MARILIQGTSSLSPGSIEIFKDFLSNGPNNIKVIVLCPSSLKSLTFFKNLNKKKNNYKLYFVPHSISGIALGPFIDLVSTLILEKINLIDHYINFQNYGLCFSSNFSLFFHNGHYIGRKNTLSRVGKFKLIFKKQLLIFNFKKAKKIFVQTNHMFNDLKSFYKQKNINDSNIELLPINLPKKKLLPPIKKYNFQLFYPCMDLPHKRCNLAINSVINTTKVKKDIGLIITIKKSKKYKLNRNVNFIGSLNKEKVLKLYSGSNALLITSDRESLGLPILEAISYSIPIIAPRLPYVEELLGNSACYFENFSEKEVENAILNCYENYLQWKEKINYRKKLFERNSNTMNKCWESLISCIK